MPISHESWTKLLSGSGATSLYFLRSASVNTNDRSRSPLSRGISGTLRMSFQRRAMRRAFRNVARHFDSLGALCVVGHQTACAELTVPFARDKALRFSGL